MNNLNPINMYVHMYVSPILFRTKACAVPGREWVSSHHSALGQRAQMFAILHRFSPHTTIIDRKIERLKQTPQKRKKKEAMAQLGLAILVVPETTVELFKLAKVAVERIQTFRYASKLLNELKTFGYDLCDGQLHLAVQLVESFIINDGAGRSGNKEIKTLTEKYLNKLRARLMETQGILDKCVDGDAQVKRLYYTVKGERELKRILKIYKSGNTILQFL